MTNFSHFRSHVATDPKKFFKSTVFQGKSLLVGINCLEPGQSQAEHVHGNQDKFYYVVEGHGKFVVGEETRAAGKGMVVFAPAGVSHGVSNHGSAKLVLLVGMSQDSGSASTTITRRKLMPTKRVRKSAKRAVRKAKKTAKRARKAAGRVKRKATKTAKRAKKAAGRAKKKATKTAKRAKKAAKRARKAVKRGATKAKATAKRAKTAAGRARKKASATAKRTKRALGAVKKKAAKTAKRARKAVSRIKKRR